MGEIADYNNAYDYIPKSRFEILLEKSDKKLVKKSKDSKIGIIIGIRNYYKKYKKLSKKQKRVLAIYIAYYK